MLWEAFAKNNIEIPFPQRDLNLGNGWEKIWSRRRKNQVFWRSRRLANAAPTDWPRTIPGGRHAQFLRSLALG